MTDVQIPVFLLIDLVWEDISFGGVYVVSVDHEHQGARHKPKEQPSVSSCVPRKTERSSNTPF